MSDTIHYPGNNENSYCKLYTASAGFPSKVCMHTAEGHTGKGIITSKNPNIIHGFLTRVYYWCGALDFSDSTILITF